MRPLTTAAALLGGLIWLTTVSVTALRPVGVPGAHRSTLDLHPAILVSFLLMGVASAALAMGVSRSVLARSGVALVWLGAIVFGVNVAFILATGDDAPVWPTHYLGILVVALGTAALSLGLFRAGALPVRAAAVAVAAAAALPFSQMQDARVLLWLPLGAAWLAIGLLTVRRLARGDTTRTATPDVPMHENTRNEGNLLC